MQISTPYLLFLGDEPSSPAAKTAQGLAYWRPEICLGQHRLEGSRADLGLPEMTPQQAVDLGARTMVIGVANVGGFIAESWVPALRQALEAGLDLASGLHTRLAGVPELSEAASRLGRRLHDVRQPDRSFPPGSGRRRSGKRLLTVGTDCAVGKMYTALALHREMRRRGVDADFRATGQTGILIAGSGVCVDAVVSDFVSGAAEWLSPDNEAEHWDLVEGQGTVLHPAYAGVTVGLVHGSQPDALVLCHEAGRERLHGHSDFPLPSLEDAIDAHLRVARLTNPGARCIGISCNTSRLDEPSAIAWLQAAGERTGLPCVDPVRGGAAPLVEALLAAFPPAGELQGQTAVASGR